MLTNRRRGHPADALMAQASSGSMPHRDEFAIEGVSEADRRLLERTAREAVELRRAGDHKAARDLAHDTAAEVVDRSAEHIEPPAPLPTDPRELVRDIPRW